MNRPEAVSAEYVCRRCAAQGGSCCRLGRTPDASLFPVSRSEELRIRACLPGEDLVFLRPEANPPSFVESLERLFPGEASRVSALFPPEGEHRRLALDETGGCVLLGEEGCRLPPPARPWFCRIFPFWIIKGNFILFSHPDCLAIKEARPAALFRLFGVGRAEILDLYARLRLDWGFPEY